MRALKPEPLITHVQTASENHDAGLGDKQTEIGKISNKPGRF